MLDETRVKPSSVPITVVSRSHGILKARVNVVDIASRDTVESFLLVLDAEKPRVDMVRPITIKAGAQNFYKTEFTNPNAKEPAEFTLVSSDAALIFPKAETLSLQANETSELHFIVPAQEKPGSYEAVVHINGKKSLADAKNALERARIVEYSKSILFKITVTKN